MIVLDTNVIAEPLRAKPDEHVLAWLDKQLATDLYLTTTSLTELQLGIAIMPEGKRRRHLDEQLSAMLFRLFGDRILVVDQQAALIHARIAAKALSQGKTINFADAQIAAIAMAMGFAVATRDVQPFEVAGVEVINPWGVKAE